MKPGLEETKTATYRAYAPWPTFVIYAEELSLTLWTLTLILQSSTILFAFF